MAKVATKYFVTEPYSVSEKGLNLERNQVSESIFSLANEYMGVRGTAEEGISADTLRGSYFNGIYEYAREDVPMHYKGIVKRTHFMINSVDYLAVEIYADGERLDTAKCTVKNFERSLDFKSGVLTRSFVWNTKSGKKVLCVFKRFLSMTKCRRAYQKLYFEGIDGRVNIQVNCILNGNVLHWGDHCYWEHENSGASENLIFVSCVTPTTNQRVVSVQKIQTTATFNGSKSGEYYACNNYSFELNEGQSEQIVRYTVNNAVKNIKCSEEQDRLNAIEELELSANEGFDIALKNSVEYWNNFWNTCDIEIEGDEENQQGIRFCLFQLQQTYHGYDPENNIGAKGLTGEAYSGHAFWDTETYCLPYYLLNNPVAAKNLLIYRYSKLEQAKQRAKMLDCDGACYPIATLNGNEGCTLWQHASLQFQPSTAVVYGVWHYALVTGDEKFVKDYGFEMVYEVVKFLLSRGDWNASKTKFGFYSVMGPDEFQMMVNHNCYTNYMAKRCFEYFISLCSRYLELCKKFGVSKEFLAQIQRACECTYLPTDKSGMIYEQHEGYFELPHIDIHSIPVTDFPLYDNWSYDRIYRNDMIKQPDVLMFMLLYNQSFSKQCKLANYEFYEPRTIHESSLSPSVHSIFASELGKHDEALKFFGFATRMDLDDYNRNANQGLHTTSIAAAWMNIVYGFGGIRTDGEKLVINPTIPGIWKSYSFKINYKGSIAKIKVEQGKATVSVIGKPLTAVIAGKEVTVSSVYEFAVKNP
ncbi:MAG: glycoside hydrolase family 65 protein [Clostridia bacterium]|nr:glycoside hydrolase family 65 protein [Clostridia bacterium]